MTTRGIDLAPPSVDMIDGISTAGAAPGMVLTFDADLNLVPGVGGGGGGGDHLAASVSNTAGNPVQLAIGAISQVITSTFSESNLSQPLHAAMTIVNDTNSAMTLALTGQELSVSIDGTKISHDTLASPNGNSNEQHMTAAQIALLHNGLTVSNDTNSAATLSVDSNQVLTCFVNPSALSGAHSNLSALNGDSNVQHLTATEKAALGGILYTNALPSVITVGGIASGSTFSAKTVSAMFDDLLYPELFPTLTAPSSTFTASVTGFQETGATVATITFSSGFSRGTISPAYGTSGLRSGLPNAYVFTGSGLPASDASTSLTNTQTVSNHVVTAGAQSWTGRVSYDVGVQPLSSKANNYSTPLSAGQTGVVTRTITGVYPWFATTSAIATLTKQSLVAHASQVISSMVAESGSDKQTIDFPVAWGAITALAQYNTLSGQYDSVSLSSFTVTDVTNTIQGNSVAYKRYTHNGSTTGARQLRWTV